MEGNICEELSRIFHTNNSFIHHDFANFCCLLNVLVNAGRLFWNNIDYSTAFQNVNIDCSSKVVYFTLLL